MALSTVLSGCSDSSLAQTGAPVTAEQPEGTTAGQGEGVSGEQDTSDDHRSARSPSSSPTGAPNDDQGSDTEKSRRSAAADKPALERRPDADLSDEEIRRIYSDDAEPGEPVTATLCNLTQEHLELVEGQITGPDGINSSNLRLALISLGDDLGVWEGLTWHLPEAAADIDTAREIYAYWDFALSLQETEDAAAAQDQLDAAAEAIDRLPADPDVELGCSR